VTKRERDLKRHAEKHHKADSRKKTENLHESVGQVNPFRKPVAAGEKEKKPDDPLVFELSRKIFHITQGGALVKTKTQSKSTAEDRRKLSSAHKITMEN
jgi:hypothetical protein